MPEESNNQHLALPRSGKGPGILVLHAWWGLTGYIRNFCDRLAQEGYVALAPDMFSGEVLHTIAEAEAHLSRFDEARVGPPIILPAAESLGKHTAVSSSGVGVIGFSMGAYWALWLAEQKPELIHAVTLFYGSNGGGGDFSRSNAAFLGHFAEKDPYETPEGIQKLKRNLKGARRPVSFYTYPGTGHWFMEDDRPDAYNAPAAQLAWERTLEFLRTQPH